MQTTCCPVDGAAEREEEFNIVYIDRKSREPSMGEADLQNSGHPEPGIFISTGRRSGVVPPAHISHPGSAAGDAVEHVQDGD